MLHFIPGPFYFNPFRQQVNFYHYNVLDSTKKDTEWIAEIAVLNIIMRSYLRG